MLLLSDWSRLRHYKYGQNNDWQRTDECMGICESAYN